MSNVFELQVDALTTSRGKEGAWVVERLLNQVIKAFFIILNGATVNLTRALMFHSFLLSWTVERGVMYM